MKSRPYKLLIIGGYGTFGGRLARLMSDEARLTIMIGGRSLHKATTFANALSGPAEILPVRFDRDGDVRGQLASISPDIVVDASGPWQAYGHDPYRLARAAIECGAHYLDLADSKDFVCNISELDDAARKQNVFVLAGVSTCPVLTSAAARHLSSDLEEISSVTGGIAPSPFAGMGRSVVEAIASYAGMPVTTWKDNKLKKEHAFVSTRCFTVRPPGCVPLPPMTFSLIEVPDLELLRSLHRPVRSIWFGVSTLPAVYHALLRLLARGVRAKLVPSLSWLSAIMLSVMNHLAWGEHRGGMFIEVRGRTTDGKQIERSWHLIAEGDTGPNVPVLAANIIIRRYLQIRTPAPGARTAKDILSMADYEPMFRQLGIRTGEYRSDELEDQPLFRKAMGSAWAGLPAPIRELHGETGACHFSGQASVVRGRSFLSRLIAGLAGFPEDAQDIPVTVHMESTNGEEHWHRNFDGHRFSSEYSSGRGRHEGLTCERFGPVKFAMALVAKENKLLYVPRRWTFLGVPMPKTFLPGGEMYETATNGKFHFHVEISLPIVGHLVTYTGWFEPASFPEIPEPRDRHG